MLRQGLKAVAKLVSARTLNELAQVGPTLKVASTHIESTQLVAPALNQLAQVAPGEAAAAAGDDSLEGLYGQQADMFEREFLTETEFSLLFANDAVALDRLGVSSVEELGASSCTHPCVASCHMSVSYLSQPRLSLPLFPSLYLSLHLFTSLCLSLPPPTPAACRSTDTHTCRLPSSTAAHTLSSRIPALSHWRRIPLQQRACSKAQALVCNKALLCSTDSSATKHSSAPHVRKALL